MRCKLAIKMAALIAIASMFSTPAYSSPTIIAQADRDDANNQAAVNRESPAQFVGNYYGNINFERYQEAWEQLSPRLQGDPQRHTQNYGSYLDWWKEQVKLVEGEVTVKEQTARTALVHGDIKYTMYDGREVPSLIRVYLILNQQTDNWMIDNIEKID